MRRVMLELRKAKEYKRCHKCGRVLFPRKDGKLPLHKVPATVRKPHGGKGTHMPLTGPEAPWCQ